jgi:MraZ protein
MWQRFTSSFTNKVDAKGRVSLPAPWRKVLEARGADGYVVFVPGFRQKGCLEGYAPDAFEEIARNIERMHPADQRRINLERRVMGQAAPVQIDETGRLALPGQMRARYGLSGEAVFVGMGDRFELWEKGAHDAMLEAMDEDGDALAHMPWPGADPEAAP